MRVSDLYRQNSFTQDVQQRLTNLTRIQQELGSGQRIFQPSEDVSMSKQALESRSTLAEQAQYIRNIDDGRNFVSAATTNINSIIELINEIDSLAVAADNDTNLPVDRTNFATQIDQKLEALTELINSSHGDRYLFAGVGTTSIPFTIERDANGHVIGATANEDTIGGKIYRRIGQNEDVQINVPGDRLFQPQSSAGTSDDIFYVISSLRNTIANNNVPPPGEEGTLATHILRENLDVIRDRITEQQTYLGAAAQRLDARKSHLLELNIQETDELEQAKGVEMTDLVSRLAMEEGVYNSLMTINTRIMTKSIIDFLG